MENWCWNIRKIKKTGQGLSEELGKYIWLAKADTSQEAPASKSGSGSSSLLIEEKYKIKSQKGDILFLDGLSLKKIECTNKDLEKVKESAAEVLKIIETERYPIEAEGGTKCRDCYYKKICGR